MRADDDRTAEMLEGLDSQDAAPRKTARSLRATKLGGEYERASDEWYAAGDALLWDGTAGDGLVNDAPR